MTVTFLERCIQNYIHFCKLRVAKTHEIILETKKTNRKILAINKNHQYKSARAMKTGSMKILHQLLYSKIALILC